MSRLVRFLSLLLLCSLAPALFAQTNLALSYDSFPQLAPGSGFIATANYANYGPGAATEVKLTITAPPGFQYEKYDAYPSLLSCTEPPKDGQGSLVCTASSVGVVDYAYVNVTMRVDPAALPGTVITTSATLTSSNAIKPLTASASTTVIPEANLRLAMSAPASITLGSNSQAADVTFPITFTVTNDGPATAKSVQLLVARQALVRWGPLTGPPGWTCASSCTIASFPPGTATFTMSATVPSSTILTSVKEEAQVGSFSDGDFSDNDVTSSTAIIVPPKSTLAIALTAAPSVVYTGDQLTYTATITNTSTVDAQNVHLTSTLNGTLVAESCGTPTTACIIPTLAPGASQTVTSTIRVDAGPGVSLFASETVGASNSDPVPSNTAVLSMSVAGTPHVDLGVAIPSPQNSIHVGGSGGWQVQVTNSGLDPATDWQLTVPIPPNTTLAGGSVFNYGTCSSLTPSPTTTQVTCHGTYLTKGDVFVLQLSLALAPGIYTPVHLTATVSPGTNVDTNPDNNTAAVDTPVYTTAYMGVAATTDKTSALAGERVTHTFTATNNGPDPALDAQLNITLPQGATFVSMNSGFPTCTGTGPVHCVAPLFPAGTTLQTAISFNAPPSPNLYASNAVLLWGSWLPASFEQSTAYVNLKVLGASSGSDVSVYLSAPSTVATGDTVTYTIEARNLGAAPAANVTVQLPLPPSLALSFASPQCTGSAVVTCNAGTLASGAATTFTVTARTLTTGTVTATASVTTTSPELNAGNNTATATVAVVNAPSPADVGVTAAAAPATVQTGDDITYTLTARNAGTATASNVTVHFGLPSTVTFVSASPGCTGTSEVICTAGTLDNGASAVFVVTARALQAGSITTTATVSTTSFDPNSLNNSTSTTIIVNAPPTAPPTRRRAARH